ncbi:hypothetical protein D6D01_02580 [Aureobasidium pullulans]|uniref:Uncharacterized protein n=1 Tax=Aureobasidium pullulans TaxID=5580 RepID=A0A4S9LTH1_AURPU|nr:hypothetical protein D6D01_02580 [Aureobasidium pullulans]
MVMRAPDAIPHWLQTPGGYGSPDEKNHRGIREVHSLTAWIRDHATQASSVLGKRNTRLYMPEVRLVIWPLDCRHTDVQLRAIWKYFNESCWKIAPYEETLRGVCMGGASYPPAHSAHYPSRDSSPESTASAASTATYIDPEILADCPSPPPHSAKKAVVSTPSSSSSAQPTIVVNAKLNHDAKVTPEDAIESSKRNKGKGRADMMEVGPSHLQSVSRQLLPFVTGQFVLNGASANSRPSVGQTPRPPGLRSVHQQGQSSGISKEQDDSPTVKDKPDSKPAASPANDIISCPHCLKQHSRDRTRCKCGRCHQAKAGKSPRQMCEVCSKCHRDGKCTSSGQDGKTEKKRKAEDEDVKPVVSPNRPELGHRPKKKSRISETEGTAGDPIQLD